jgi:SAM-dependent methyltransferase
MNIKSIRPIKIGLKQKIKPRIERVYQIYNAMRITEGITYFTAVAKMSIGLPSPVQTECRKTLECTILPYFSENDAFRRILFVGCATYTWHYKRLFTKKEYWTIDPVTRRAVFGAKKHIVGTLRQMTQYVGKEYFDLIICNGILGFGLDNLQDVEASFKTCHYCLRPGGILIVGWNDIPERAPRKLEEYKILRNFQPYVFSPLGTTKYLTKTKWRHTYNFYIKPISDNPSEL